MLLSWLRNGGGREIGGWSHSTGESFEAADTWVTEWAKYPVENKARPRVGSGISSAFLLKGRENGFEQARSGGQPRYASSLSVNGGQQE